MHHSSFSAASRSSGQPDKPAAAPTSSNHSSAEQPATPFHLKISSIHDVLRWMAEEPTASCSSADAQRINEASLCSYDPVHVHRRGVFDPRAPFAPMISECDGHIFTDVRHSHSQEVDVYREPWMQPNCIGVVGDKGQVAQLLRKPALLFDDKEENIDDLRSRIRCSAY